MTAELLEVQAHEQHERSRCPYRPECSYWDSKQGYYPEGCARIGGDRTCRAIAERFYQDGFKDGEAAATQRTLVHEGLAGGTHKAAAVDAPGIPADTAPPADGMAGRADAELRADTSTEAGTSGDMAGRRRWDRKRANVALKRARRAIQERRTKKI